jgi:hypothetical protein
MLLRHQSELTAGGQIEHFRSTPDFDDDGSEPFADEAFVACPQRSRRVRRVHDQHTRWIVSQFQQTVSMQFARFKCGKILPHPQKPFVFGIHARGERQRKTCCHCFFSGRLREYLMQGVLFEASKQRRIGARVTKADSRLSGRACEETPSHKALQYKSNFLPPGHAATTMFLLCSIKPNGIASQFPNL